MKQRSIYTLVAVLFISTPLEHLLANPAGETVTAGSATFNRAGTTLTINQGTPRLIVNWSDFSIGAGQLTRFVQPGVSSIALNRVVTASPTTIYGTLQANGSVYLINPNGIMVGPGGVINTRSFVGSTLNIDDASFLRGVGLTLKGTSTASVENQGAIQALGGDIFLVARTVQNSGTLQAPNGTVGLAAGTEVILQQAGMERIAVVAGTPSASNLRGVNNVGAIQAATAELKAAGGNIYALAINNGGIIRANTVVNEGGRIFLRADGGNVVNSGTLNASATAPGAQGGEVQMLGGQVALNGNAVVDVSGPGGGGTALIGGDYQGRNPNIPNAQQTFVGRDAIIKADAGQSGNGGKVIVWSDQTTVFNGNIFARGGVRGGHGGFAEVSGKRNLGFNGMANLSAPAGRSGTLLLDPGILNINAGASGSGAEDTQLDVNQPNPLDPAGQVLAIDGGVGATFNISVGKVVASLNNQDTLLQAGVTLNINAALDATANANAHNLTLSAPTINLNQPITLKAGAFLLGSAGNNTINVNSPGRIQNAIDAAVGSTTVNVGTGTFTEDLSIPAGKDGLTLAGNGAANTTIKGVYFAADRNNSGLYAPNIRIDANNVTIHAFTIESPSLPGSGTESDSIWVFGAGTTIHHNTFNLLHSDGDENYAIVTQSSGGPGLNVHDNLFTSAGSPNNANTIGYEGIYVNYFPNAVGTPVLVQNNTFNGNLIRAVTVEPSFATVSGNSITTARLAPPVGENRPVFSIRDANGNTPQTDISVIGNSLTYSGGAALSDVFLRGIQVGLGDGSQTMNSITVNNPLFLHDVQYFGTINQSSDIVAGGLINFNGPMNLLANVSITAPKIDFSGGANSVVGNNHQLTLQPANAAAAIKVGATDASVGVLDLSVSDLAALNEGFSGIVIGLATGSGAVTVNASSFKDSVTLRSPNSGGSVTVSGQLDTLGSSDVADLTLNAPSIALNAAVTAKTGSAVTLNNSVSVSGSGLVTADTLNLDGNGDVGASGGRLQAKVATVTDNKGGGTAWVNESDAVNVNGTPSGSSLDLVAGTGVTINGAMNFGAGTVSLKGTTMGNGANDVTATAITLENSGLFTAGAGKMIATAGTLTLKGNGDVGASGGRLQTTVATVTDNKGGGTAWVNETDAVNVNGTPSGSSLDLVAGTGVTINGGMDFGAGTVSLKGTTMGNGTHDVTATAITLENSGAFTAGAGKMIATAGTLTLKGNGDVGASGGRLQTTAATVTDNKGGGTAYVNETDAVNVNGTPSGSSLDLVAGTGVTINGAMDFGVGTVSLKGTTMGNGANDVTAAAITLENSGAFTAGAGKMIATAGTLTLKGNGDVGANGAELQTTVGTLTLAKGGGHSFIQETDDVNVNGSTLGNLTLAAGGNVTVNGALSAAGGLITANSGAGTLTLSGTGDVGASGTRINTTVATVTDNKSGGTAYLNETDAVNVNGTPSGSSLDLVAGTGVTINGAMNFGAGTVSLQGTTMGNGANDVTATAITLENSGAFTAGAGKMITTAGTLTLKGNGDVGASGAELQTTVGTLTLAKGGGNSFLQETDDANLNGSTLGNLTLTAGGDVTVNGALSGGAVVLNVAALTLNDAVNGSTSVTLNNSAAQTGAGKVTTPVLTLQGNGDVALNTAAGTIDFQKAGAAVVTVNEDDAVGVGGTGGGALTVNAGNTTVDAGGLGGGTVALNVAALTLNGAVNGSASVTLNNSAAQTGAGKVTVPALYLNGAGSVGAAGDRLQTDVATLTLNKTGGDTFVEETSALNLAGTTAGALDVLAHGAILDSAALHVTGDLKLDSSGNDITLDDLTSTFGRLFFKGANVSVTENAATDLADSTVTGNFTVVNRLGGISQSGPAKVTGNSFFTAPAGQSIVLDNAANEFTGPVTFIAGTVGNLNNVTIVDTTAFDLGALALDGDLDVTANGPITQSGVLTVNGAGKTATFAAGSGNDVTLGNVANDFTTAKVTSGRDVTLQDANAIDLGASTVSGNLTVTANGPITQTGALVANGAGKTATFAAGSGNDITLADAGNDFATVTLTSGRDAILQDANNLVLGASTVSGELDITSVAGDITQSGAIIANKLTVKAENGSALFGDPAAGAAAAANQPLNHIALLGNVSVKNQFYLYDSDWSAYPPALALGWPAPVPGTWPPPGAQQLGLTIVGNVQQVSGGSQNIIVRTVGDLVLAPGASVRAAGGAVALSAEKGSFASAAFHNLNSGATPSVSANDSKKVFIFSSNPVFNVPPDPTETSAKPFFYRFGDVEYFYGLFNSTYLDFQNLNLLPGSGYVFADPPTEFAPEASKFFIDLLKLPTPRAFKFEGSYTTNAASIPKTWIWTSSFKMFATPDGQKSTDDDRKAPKKLLGAAIKSQPLSAAVTLAINP